MVFAASPVTVIASLLLVLSAVTATVQVVAPASHMVVVPVPVGVPRSLQLPVASRVMAAWMGAHAAAVPETSVR